LVLGNTAHLPPRSKPPLMVLIGPLFESHLTEPVDLKNVHRPIVGEVAQERGSMFCVVNFGHAGQRLMVHLCDCLGELGNGWVGRVAAGWGCQDYPRLAHRNHLSAELVRMAPMRAGGQMHAAAPENIIPQPCKFGKGSIALGTGNMPRARGPRPCAWG